MASPRRFRRAVFVLSGTGGDEFEGFTSGETWNGWACPHFDFDTAITVLKKAEELGYKWRFVPGEDTFLVSHVQDPEDFNPEGFQAVHITVDEAQIISYAIGAYSWTWEIV